MRIKFVASVLAALSLAFVPTAAQAVATTLDVQNGGSAAVDLEAGDTLDVTVAGPIAKTGAAVHELYSTWSTQSLALLVEDTAFPEDNIIWPEGWTLEYTTDGTTWVDWAVTEPTDLLDIIALRSQGDVNTVGENTFKTTSIGALWAASFSASGNGDGFDVAAGNGKVFNMYHHNTSGASVECHTYAGETCATPVFTLGDYETNQGSRVFFDEASNKLYAFVYDAVDDSYGTICVDYSSTAVSCGFDVLDANANPEEANQGYGSQSEDNGIIWSISGASGQLMCLTLATGSACADNAWDTGLSGDTQATARVTALGGKVYYTIGDQFGCFDPAIDGRCNGSTTVTLTNPSNRHSPIPYENTSGVIQGACDLMSRQCIDTNGATLAFPASLGNFWDDYPTDIDSANDNMIQFGYGNHRLYYDTSVGEGALNNWASNNVSCFDYLTGAACAGFNGNGREGIEYIYATIYDPSTPECVWVNQDTGRIVPLDATTGEVGCVMGDPIVELPYEAITPRMACDDEGRVTEWASIDINVPSGVDMADVRFGFYDADGVPVSGWDDLDPDAAGIYDLSGLDVNDTGTTPSIRITAGDISSELAQQIAATVTFVAEDPELCFALDADNYCETNVGTPGPGSIPDGIVEGTSITRPNVGTDVGSNESSTIPGLDASETCVASALEIDLPVSQLASTGVDAGTIAMAGFAVVAVGGAAVAVTRRRKA
jgi:LPXTG-motif cell wall-anchored protein